MNKRRLARLLLEVTLLAASTLAQMASMAALSSRRRAFFSLALLDFLWGNERNEGQHRNTHNDKVMTGIKI